MRSDVSPETGRVLDIMLVMSETLPPTWQTEQFCLSSAQSLARFIADNKGRIDQQSAADIMAAGCVLMAMARTEHEASAFFFEGKGNG